MRWSQLYVPTLRDDPADADAVSHRLLLRAGYVRQLMAGHYTLLPLAVRVRTKIVNIVRAEMARIGAQEFSLPAMHPAEVWQKSGRWSAMGDEMFRLRDRKGADLVLGMTHEEIFTTLALELRSYRDLPQLWYQFQTKFRDEPRPKSGLLLVREFTMKDAYSFDLDAAGLDTAFAAQRAAYQRIFARLELPAVPVEASSGTMGGSASVEFRCPSNAGEDLIASCFSCGYAANVEKAVARVEPVADEPGPATPERFDTPGVRTISDLDVKHGVPGDRQIKTLVYVLDDELTLVLLRGDHGLAEQKLIDATGAAAVRPASPDEIVAALGASPGSLGAVGVTGGPKILADQALRGRTAMVTGANTDEVHLRGVDIARDIQVGQWADLREVVEGEPCANCGTGLQILQTIEVGHIFKLGSRYSEALDLTVLGPDGAKVTPIMGSYGIGIERALASVVETHFDDDGIIWPVNIAPFEAAITRLGADPAAVEAADRLYADLTAAGVDVILDDRDERPGVKFADVELIGIPYRVTVGGRGLKAGALELAHRATGQTETVPVADVAARVAELVTAARH